jgi:hypothetical protein
MGKALFIIILGSTMTLSIIRVNLIHSVGMGTDNAIEHYDHVQARNITNSWVNMLLTRVSDNSEYRTDGYESEYIKNGTVSYRLSDTTFAVGDTLLKIHVEVNYKGYPKSITTFSRHPVADGWVPVSIRGAWTANADLNNTISDMIIDGRDHDLNGNVVPNSGIPGISSSTAFTNEDNAEIGGTFNGIDYVTEFPENRDIIEEFYSWNGSFPESPDEILGYPEGTLKSIAQSGVGGSQYVLDPGGKDIDEKVLDFPLKGVTYIELTDGEERKLKIKGPGNSGIVVVHGPGASSRLGGVKIEELKVKKNQTIVCHNWDQIGEVTKVISVDALDDHLSHGDIQETCGANYTWFQGLIVTDYSFHHHLDILGAILQLSPDLEVSKTCNGNKDHWVKFSREAIENATKFVAEESGLVKNKFGKGLITKGFGPGRSKTTFRYE